MTISITIAFGFVAIALIEFVSEVDDWQRGRIRDKLDAINRRASEARTAARIIRDAAL